MNASGLMSRLANKIVRVAEFVSSISSQKYTSGERLNLFRARRPHGQEVNLLNYRVSFLGVGSYQLLLREIFYKGEYQFEAGSNSPVILDCGANIGLATLFFKRLYPNAQVSCFEADPTTATVLQNNIEQNHLTDVKSYNYLLLGICLTQVTPRCSMRS
jgi:hypothetical protein